MEYTMTELELLDVQLLPEREALAIFNFAGILANNTAVAVNAATVGSLASANALQGIFVVQS
jgi:hypothetical protein